MKFRCCRSLSFCAAMAIAQFALPADAIFAHPAPDTVRLPAVRVTAEEVGTAKRPTLLQSGEPGSILEETPSLAFSTNGGISALPSLRGLNSDRVKVTLDGAPATAACSNHMNSPLSYADAFGVDDAQVAPAVSSVSTGGDSLAGSIQISSLTPRFAEQPGETVQNLSLSSIYRSNGDGLTESVRAALGDDAYAFSYGGTFNRSNSYTSGDGETVRATQFEASNHAVALSRKAEGNITTLRGSYQVVPYQGFVNQYMDMTLNEGTGISIENQATFDWGTVDATAFWRGTKHDMGFFSDEKTGMMPMRTRAKELGYTVKSEIQVSPDLQLRLGNELQQFNLDDRWPAVAGSMMMGPNEYVNINDGNRQLFDTFAEVETALAGGWTATAGIRSSTVRSSTGEVQGYNTMPNAMPGMPASPMMPMPAAPGMGMSHNAMTGARMMAGGGMGMSDLRSDSAAAASFNAGRRAKQDNNIDFSLVTSSDQTKSESVSFGYSRRTRSPNLYERYSWGEGTMGMTMIGWFGDGNGYVGDVNLRPEIAHTLSATYALKDSESGYWQLKFTPYLTYVNDFIDVNKVGTFNPLMRPGEEKNLLRFANHDARIFGADLIGSTYLWRESSEASTELVTKIGWLRGERVDGGNLYRMMPLHGQISLRQLHGAWIGGLDLELVGSKNRVDARRDEDTTASYALMHLNVGYRWKQVTFDFGISNLLDQSYDLPLGGVDYADWKAEGTSGAIGPVPGAGRSFNFGIRIDL